MANCKNCGKPIWDIKNNPVCSICMIDRDMDLDHACIALRAFSNRSLEVELIYSLWKVTKEDPSLTFQQAIERVAQEWLK
jgi:hypothetical protein